MPWFPDFAIGVELARRQSQEAGRADPVTQYFRALNEGDVDDLEGVWPGEVVIHDPRAGEVRGHRHLRKFVNQNKAFFAARHARTEVIASTCVGTRAVVEVLARLDVDGREESWPLAVAVESPDDRSVIFRTYCSQWPVDGQRHLRPPILPPAAALPGDAVDPFDPVARYQAALASGDTEAVLKTFEPDGYFREPIGTHPSHRGADELRSFFTRTFGAGGGIVLQACAVTDDGVRCAVEYNCVRWGSRALPPQAGLGIHERGPDGLLAAVRAYDDIEAPR
jgi:ketosteroid isomerase-like protein